MTDTSQNQHRHCSNPNCKEEIIETDSGLAHIGGGEIVQNCRNCGFVGGQVGRYNQCPRCGDQTSLIDDHTAS